MKVSKSWLNELVDLKVSDQELEELLPLQTIALSEVTPKILELDMKGYNRADLLSMRGVAYEVAAITNSKVKFKEPDPTKFIWVEESLSKLDVQVEDENLAPVYTLARIEGLKVGSSPTEWVKKLADSGMRSVNNIADITNLVMLEYGQPLHAFDASEVKDEKIIVRTAKSGEILETLDQKKRQLEPTDLLITDPEKALGIAGVMGGKNSEITNDTTTILLEAAIFDSANLRKTSTRLGLQSEASKRFYHGLTKKRLLQALEAAIRMYQELGGKLTAFSMVGEMEDQAKKVPLTLNKTQSLIGVEIPVQKIEEYLKKLNFEVIASENGWVVTPPYYRLDIEIAEDLIEEIARMYGYENIPPQELRGELPEKIDQSLFELIYDLKIKLVDQGFTELQTYSYFSSAVLKNFSWLEAQNTWPLIKIANPISSETEYMRHNLWSNLIEKAGENLKYFERVAIFEIGKTYEVIGGKIHEEYRLAVLLVDGSNNPLSQLNQTIQAVLKNVNPAEQNSQNKTFEFFHPNRHTSLTHNNQSIGGMAEIHPRVANSFGIEKRVAIAEIKIEKLT